MSHSRMPTRAQVSLLILFVFISLSASSQVATSELKKLSMDELLNIEVTSVSKRPEKLKDAASAIQVITQQDIRNSGAKTLPEVLRLASNLQVAQVNSSQWAISARGFNNVLANKLLVLIDGRTIYTPLYAGVFWDVQNLLLEDIDHIEVISGPGGTLWGANAVNGVINIVTKNSKDTKGLFAEGAIGTCLPGLGSLRYGGKINNVSYRIYGTAFQMGNTVDTSGVDAKDKWSVFQGGVRLDWDANENNSFTLQSGAYDDRPDPEGGKAIIARGDNVSGRWNHKISESSDFQLQVYYDHTWRDFGNEFAEDLKTFDVDGQNKYQLGKRNIITYGLGFRMMDHNVQNLELFAFLPGHKKLYLYSFFVQDELMLIEDRLRFTIGTKIEKNSYTDYEYQPSGRLTWTPSEHHTIWTAVSRAVRTPSRIDRDFFLSLAPQFPVFTGSEFKSEDLIAYELGWRVHPYEKLAISLATFYNVYDNIRSAEPGTIILNYPISIGNGVKGQTYGFELSATDNLTSWWNLRIGYTYLKKNLSVKPDSKDLNNGTAESNDPEQQLLIQSTINLPGRIEFGTVVRYVDVLLKPLVPAYVGIDARIGWKLNKFVELDVVGQNLLDDRHPEFIPSSPPPREIERSIYGKIIIRL